MMRNLIALVLVLFLQAITRAEQVPTEADIIVYGGTSGGIIAAVEVHKSGKSVILISPDKHLGGLSISGLGFVDIGRAELVGGLTKDFFHQIWVHYQDSNAWSDGKVLKTFPGQRSGGGIDNVAQEMYVFEPHVAEVAYNQLIEENKIPVVHTRLDLNGGVLKSGSLITGLRMENGWVFHAKMFIDATYEGDVMAKAGVSYVIGREDKSQYGESLAGQQVANSKKNQLPQGIDPYVTPGDASSGLLPGINPTPTTADGTGDKKIQAYCYRMCLCADPNNRVPIAKPDDYRESDYELLLRVVAGGGKEKEFLKNSPLPNHKTDTNNGGGMSTDYIGMNYDYPEGDYATREKIAQAHESWQRGLLWTLQNNLRVPAPVRAAMAKWGLPKDEFTDNDNWPWSLYVREARRMVGDYVLTQTILEQGEPVARAVGLGSYGIDSHNVQRVVGRDGKTHDEGDVQKGVKPYQIDYGVLIPKNTDCSNLLVPFCISASHMAFGSVRMEPVFMILSQSSAAAASLAIDNKVSVQDVPYDSLRQKLLAEGQILDLK